MLGFVGAFGDSNYGDYAMLVNNVFELGINKFMIFTYNKRLFKELELTYFKDFEITAFIPEIDYNYNELFTGKYHTEYDLKAYTPFEILKKVLNINELRAAVNKIEKLVVCGGGYFNHIWNANHRKKKLFSILATILIANEQHKEIVFLGNTFGPFDNSAELFSNFFNCLNTDRLTLSVRDDVYSVPNLRRLGITFNISVLPDDLYFLSDSFKLNEQNIVNLPENYFIFEIYSSLDDIKEHLGELRDAFKAIKTKYNADVVLLPLDSCWGGAYQCEFIKQQIPEVTLILPDSGFLPVEKLVHIVDNAKLVICQRYHLFLTALSRNVPCLQIMKEVCGDFRYYYCKTKGLLNQVFSEQIYDEALFMYENACNALSKVVNSMCDIISLEKSYFNSEKIKSEQEMLKLRKEYLCHKLLTKI